MTTTGSRGTPLWKAIAAPAAFFLGALSLLGRVTDHPEQAAAMTRGIAGPTTWPTVMLYAVMLFAVTWAIGRVVARGRDEAGRAGADRSVAARPDEGRRGVAGTGDTLADSASTFGTGSGTVATRAATPGAATPGAAGEGAEEAGVPQWRIWLGIVLVLAYGFSLPILGFPLATFVYLVLWLPLGGERAPLRVGLTALVGTTVLLYRFVKLALMPLDRGVGAIGEATVALYRLLGIY